MLDALKGLFGSKKFWMTILGSMAVAALAMVLPAFGLAPEMIESVLTYVAGFFGVGLAGIGLADLGKEKAMIEGGK